MHEPPDTESMDSKWTWAPMSVVGHNTGLARFFSAQTWSGGLHEGKFGGCMGEQLPVPPERRRYHRRHVSCRGDG